MGNSVQPDKGARYVESPLPSTPSVKDIPHVNGFPRYSEAEMERRHAGLREMMDRHDLGAVIIVGAAGPLETSVQFYTNWPPLVESYVVATPNGDMTLFVRLWNHLPDAERTATLEDVQYGGDTPVEQAHTVANALARAVAKDARIGIIGPLRYADALILQETLRNVTW